MDRSFGTFLFLLAFYIGYLLMGGYMFHRIECTEEMAVKRRVVVKKMESMMLVLEGLHDEDAPPALTPITSDIKQIMIGNRIYEEDKEKYKVCETWGFFNSFFFGFTSVTTIGYGKISPQTQLGRVACLIYCIIGIPLNTVVIGSIGNFLMKKGSEYFHRHEIPDPMCRVKLYLEIVLRGFMNLCFITLAVLKTT